MSSGPTREGMIRYMDEAAQIVASWPKWKREVLRESTGELMTDTPRPTAEQIAQGRDIIRLFKGYGDFIHNDDALIVALIFARAEQAEADRDRLREELERAKAREKKLVAVVEDALSPGVFGPWSTVDDPRLAKSNLRELCDAVGYGAVMHYTEYLWKEKAERLGHPGSEHTCAACASVRRGWIKAATDALTAPDAGQGERGEKA